MEEALFALQGVSYSYLDRFAALADVNLEIKAHEKIAIIGANGSGKSTLLHILAGLIFPAQGRVMAFGSELTESRFRDSEFNSFFRSRVGILFQNPDTQLFNSSVEDELAFGLVQMNLQKREIMDRIEESLAFMGIRDLRERHPQWLSLGEKKRVCLASILAMEPEVLLLDEPTAGLDPTTMCHLIDSIMADADGKRTVITATHDLHIVCEIADKVIVLSEEKRVVKEARPEELFSDRPFLERHNLVHSHAHRHKNRVHTHYHDHVEHYH